MQHLMAMGTPKNALDRRTVGLGPAAALVALSTDAEANLSGPLRTARTTHVSGLGGL